MIKIWSITDKLILARDSKKKWYEVHKKDVHIGEEIDSSFCTPLNKTDSKFHEGIKELSDSVYGPRL